VNDNANPTDYADRTWDPYQGRVQASPDLAQLRAPLWWTQPGRVRVLPDLFSAPDEIADRAFAVMALCPDSIFFLHTSWVEWMRHYFQNMERRGGALRATVEAVDAQFYLKYGDPQRNCARYARPERLEAGFRAIDHMWRGEPLPNVWLGARIKDQATADERIPLLLDTPAARRFVLAELGGPVDLTKIKWHPIYVQPNAVCRTGLKGWSLNNALQSRAADEWNPEKVGLDWLLVGGESRPSAQPCEVAWIRSLVEQARDASVPCFVEQLGSRVIATAPRAPEWPGNPPSTRVDQEGCPHIRRVHLIHSKGADPAEWPEDLRVREVPE